MQKQTRVWCARVPYDVYESRSDIERLLGIGVFDDSIQPVSPPRYIYLSTDADRPQVILAVKDISAIQPLGLTI